MHALPYPDSRQRLEEQAFQRKEEDLRSELEACGSRAAELEKAVSEGGEREAELRKVVQAARSVCASSRGSMLCLCRGR